LLALFSLPLFEAPKNITFIFALLLFFSKNIIWRNKIHLSGIDKALLLFLSLTIVSAIFSPYRVWTLKKGVWDTFRFVMFFFLIKYSINTSFRIRFAILAIIISMIIGDLIGIKHYLKAPSLESINFIGYHTATATYLAFFLSLVFGILLTNNIEKRAFLFLVGIATILTWIVLSLSLARIALFSVAIIFLLFCVFRRHFKILALGCLLSIVAVFLFIPLKGRIGTLKQPFSQSLQLRYGIWEGAARIIKDRPFLGIGPRTYHLEENCLKYSLPRDIRSSDAHNIFLNIASEHGLLGLLAFLVFLGAYLHLLYKTRNIQAEISVALWYACFGNLIHLFLIGTVHSVLATESAMFFMAILGLFSSSIETIQDS
jgi:O-antigen ligase